MLIDTQKIPDLIRKLRDLERLSSDPDMLPLLESISVNSGAAPTAPVKRQAGTKRHSKSSKKGDLKKGVGVVVAGLSGRFTAPSVVTIMKRNGFVFAAKNPNIAVNGVLRKMVGAGTVVIAVEGSGRTPNEYERTGKGSGD